jgi:hypothetical protein
LAAAGIHLIFHVHSFIYSFIHDGGGAQDGAARVWDVSPKGGFKCLAVLSGGQNVAWLDGGRLVATASAKDGTCRVWRLGAAAGGGGDDPPSRAGCCCLVLGTGAAETAAAAAAAASAAPTTTAAAAAGDDPCGSASLVGTFCSPSGGGASALGCWAPQTHKTPCKHPLDSADGGGADPTRVALGFTNGEVAFLLLQTTAAELQR